MNFDEKCNVKGIVRTKSRILEDNICTFEFVL